MCLYLARGLGAALDYDLPVLSDIQDAGRLMLLMGDLCGLSGFSIYLLN